MNRRGFTLMELLLSLAIASIVITICYAILITTMQAQQEGSTECRWARIQAAVLDVLSEDIAQATVPTFVSSPDKEETTPLDGGLKTDSGEKNPAETDESVTKKAAGSKFFSAEERPSYSDEGGISFVVASPIYDSNSGKYYLYRVITYFIKRDSRTNANLLFRRERIGWNGELDEDGSAELLCDIVDDFKIEYYDGLEWLSEWVVEEKGDLPIAVRVKISFFFETKVDGLPDTNGKSEEFYTIIRIRASRYIAQEDENRRIREGLVEQPVVY